MALTGEHTEQTSGRVRLARLTGPIKAWLADRSDSALVQRMAGGAFLIRVASAAIAYLSQIVLARWMGSSEFGLYVYVWTWVLLIGGLGDLGLAIAAQRFVPEYTERGALAELRGYLAGSRALAMAIATVLALLCALAVYAFSPWLTRQEIIPLVIVCVSLPFYALTGVQDGIARSYNWTNLALVPPFIVRPLLLIVLMALAYAAGLPADATTAIIAAVAATWITAIGQLLVLNRRLAPQVPPGPKAYAPRTWLATSFPIFLAEGFYLLLTYTDVLLLKQFRSPEEVAVYYAAAKTLALVAFISFAVGAATAHKFSAYHVAGDRARLAALVADATRWTFWPSLAVTLLIVAFGKPFLWLFGPSFVAGYPVMFVLAVGWLARASVGPVERLLNMSGEQRVCAIVYGFAFALNVCGCVFLIPPFGIFGAACATALAVVVETAVLLYFAKQRLGLNVFIWRRSA